jgi:hypothetical protein
MAALTAAARKQLASSSFAGPGRSYPVNDPAHAANAKARATQAVNSGRMSAAQAARIKARANTVLKRKKKGEKSAADVLADRLTG